MARQALNESQTNRVLIPLLEKPDYKGKLMNYYFGRKLRYNERAYRDAFFGNKIINPYLKSGIIFPIENLSADSKRKYFDINWKIFINALKERKFRYFSNLSDKDLNELANLCNRHRTLIFSQLDTLSKR